MSVLPARHPVTADEFERMIAAGVFADDDRLELIDGEIVDMSPIGSAHQACVNRLHRAFNGLSASDRAIVQMQGAFRANARSRPQPDVALLRWRADFYVDALPGPADVHLLVEVADSSLRFDRWVKLPAYAVAGVPEAWVVDIQGGVVEVAREPSELGYSQIVQLRRGDVLSPEAFPDFTIAIDDIVG